MKPKLIRAVLLALHACGGLPMPEPALVSAAALMVVPHATDGDVMDAVRECEASGMVSGLTDDLTRERSWTLTERGEHKARQLR